MLFMGEEFDASTPFLYFCDFHDDLAAAVTRGRREEFKRFPAFTDPAARDRIPDPNAASTFEASKLRWDERDLGPHAARLAQVRALLATRCAELVPRLRGTARGGTYRVDGELLGVDWTLGDGSRWHLLAHFGRAPRDGVALPPGRVVHRHRFEAAGAGQRAQPGAVAVTLETAGE